MKDTHDLDLVRDYSVGVDRLWRVVTEPRELMQWFGPEGVSLDLCEMNFTRTGPWRVEMRGRESGQIFRNSGQVTHVRPPESGLPGSVGFTWAWTDDEGHRGVESHVTFTVEATPTGARLTVSHRGLPDIEASQGHSRGWLSTLTRLDRHIGQSQP